MSQTAPEVEVVKKLPVRTAYISVYIRELERSPLQKFIG